MFKPPCAAAVFVAAATAFAAPVGAAMAQQPATPPAAPTPSTPAPTAAAPAAPVPAARPAPPLPPGVVATVNNPNLAVANVKLESGLRLGRLLGAAVQNEQGERIGTVDDLVVAPDNRLSLAVISVGGFLGLGGKLVAVPWTQLRPEADRVVLPGVSKEQLDEMPGLIY